MMDPAALYDACHTSLVRCLYTVAEHCPDIPAGAPPLHRLRNVAQVLVSSAPSRGDYPETDLTLAQSFNLLSTSQELLVTLRGAGAAGRISGEMHQSLSAAVDALAAHIGASLREARALRVRGLYVIIDPQVTDGRDPLTVAASAVRGGARMLQLRDKLRDKGELLPAATYLQQLCQDNDIDLIINDHADLAAVVGCAGLHVGQTDLPVAEARRVLSSEQVLGRSNHELDELVQSQEMRADHVAFGAIYATGTKGLGRPPQGVDQLRRAKELSRVPLVAIGGINIENVAPVVEAGADAVCVTAAVGMAPEPEAAAAGLVEAIRNAGGRI